MYNLKTTKLKSSWYDFVPLFLFLWGTLFALYFLLAPQFILYLFAFIAVTSSVFIICINLRQKMIGSLSIVANQAWLDVEDKRFSIEFESFNGWRLFARFTLEMSPAIALSNRNFFIIFLRKLLVREKYISIYHTSLDRKTFNYLRSFAAYQCLTKNKHS